jgi:protein AaeX
MTEFNLAGIYLPPLLAYAALALVPFLVLRTILAKLNLLRFVWHPALFETALYLSILSLLVLVA